MRIISFNANGIRSALNKGFASWLGEQNADIVCLQETRIQAAQRQGEAFYPDGWHCIYVDALKKGYSGVAIWSRHKSDAVQTALGVAALDEEGRYVEARFGALSVVSLYLPSGSSGPKRQDFKFQVLDALTPLFQQWLSSGRHYVLCGDFNIVRSALDIKNWKSNQKNSGCLPAERDWLNGLCANEPGQMYIAHGRGWVDAYRRLHPHGCDYTWWSNRGQARANNVGWRIDYQLATPIFAKHLQACSIYRQQRFSDHAPFSVDYSVNIPGE